MHTVGADRDPRRVGQPRAVPSRVRGQIGTERRAAVTEQILDEKLEAAVQRLDPRFRLVLLLVDVDQLTYTEAAQVLGIPTGTVMSRLSRARARIRADLRGAGISLGRTP